MLTVSTPDLDLIDVTQADDPDYKRVHVAFPLNRLEGTEDSAVVFFTVQPGERLASHTDSAEEILYIVSGEAIAEVGDERGRVRAGDLAVVPAMAPHGLINDGDEPVTVVGFFSEAEITSTFEHPLQPLGQSVVTMGVAVPA
jgi:quercetin dioxygenase-like cupin family protein